MTSQPVRTRRDWWIAAAAAGMAAAALTACGNADPPVPAAAQAAQSPVSALGGALEGGSDPPPPPAELPVLPGLDKLRFDSAIRAVAEREDPVADGWESERFNDLADVQFKKIGKMLASPELLDEEHAAELASPTFSSAGLRPKRLDPVYSEATITVKRGEIGEADRSTRGPASLIELLGEQAEPLRGLGEIRFKFKIIRVETGNPATDTTSYFQISGRGSDRSVQVNATWQCRWEGTPDSGSPLLTDIEVTSYEEIEHRFKSGQPLFSECTISVFRGSEVFDRQLAFGIDHWTDRLDGAIARPAAGHGLAIGDVNGDGLEDVYLCQPPALPNLLLIQNPDGTVTDTAVAAGVHWLEGTRAAILNDLDNDGDLDLVVVFGSKAAIHSNDGTGKFELVAVIDTPSSLFAINAVDYDGDGYLDLYLCGYTLTSDPNKDDIFANPMPFEDANNGAPNVMLRNDGNMRFTEVTASIGLDQNNRRFSYASSWEDFDGDGDLDVYVANDFGRNNLYRNDGGTFVDVAAELGVEDIGPGMSAAWGDFNNDALPDLYVSNMFSSAGNRITHQDQFKAELEDGAKGVFRRHARGNSLFENAGAGNPFIDRSVELGVTLGRWAWGSVFADLNNDGWQDLYVTNGFITSEGKDPDL